MKLFTLVLVPFVLACGAKPATPTAHHDVPPADAGPVADSCCCTLKDGTDVLVAVTECNSKQGTCGEASICEGIKEPIP